MDAADDDIGPTDASPSLQEALRRFVACMGDPTVRSGIRRGFRATPEEMGRAAVSAAARGMAEDGCMRPRPAADPADDV